MHVVATAGHVDHGKSTLVRALTGMEPDRWAEERRRGMTIDLGFAWTALPSGRQVAFVDVPGHERFVGNMLAGVGPVPAVLLVVAADEGVMPQTVEHLQALAALGVAHGLLVITRTDLADPAQATSQAHELLAGTPLAGAPTVPVSAASGAGLPDLVAALDDLVGRLPGADPAADVRLWIDRAFTVRGSGTVVTGTLPAGTVRVGDELQLTPSQARVRVRGLQCLGVAVDEASGVCRLAVNLRGVDRDQVSRGQALLTPDRWLSTADVDVRLSFEPADEPLPERLQWHAGSATVPCRVRPLGTDTARVRLAVPLPLRIGDRALLRDPGRHLICAGAVVLDPLPPRLAGRGAAARRAAELAVLSGRPDGAGELHRRGLVPVATLRALGADPPAPPLAGGWLVEPAYAERLRTRLADLVAAEAADRPLSSGLPVEAARQRLGLPDARLVTALLRPPLVVRDGRVLDPTRADPLPAAVRRAVEGLRAELAERPYAAPDADRLAALGLGGSELAAAVRAGLLVRVADGVYLAPGAVQAAAQLLAALPQPFTLSEARQALGTSRRVAVPLLESLDAAGRTIRLPDSRRRMP